MLTGYLINYFDLFYLWLWHKLGLKVKIKKSVGGFGHVFGWDSGDGGSVCLFWTNNANTSTNHSNSYWVTFAPITVYTINWVTMVSGPLLLFDYPSYLQWKTREIRVPPSPFPFLPPHHVSCWWMFEHPLLIYGFNVLIWSLKHVRGSWGRVGPRSSVKEEKDTRGQEQTNLGNEMSHLWEP